MGIYACSHKTKATALKTYEPIAYNKEVSVLEINDKKPEQVEVLGTIRIRDTGFSLKCNKEMAIEKAKLKAREMGGNWVHITKHKKPDLWSTCHRLDAIVYRSNSN
ncbi:hypothetical protein GCM10011414_22380 [Croceivirga lutea]|nr:hypothetical protein GCM10011414_22380 [Croceivirga lutea]